MGKVSRRGVLQQGVVFVFLSVTENSRRWLLDPEERNEAAPQISEAQEEDDISEIADDDTPQLVVSCFCERGKHRSVAFAEELSRHKWPREWAVELHHRDVEEANGNKQHQKNKSKANRKRQGDHGFGGSDVE